MYIRLTAILLAVLSASIVHAEDACRRIVSLAPSISSVLEELGLGQKIVGVTSYDGLLKDSSEVKAVGGYIDPDIETIYRLKPTIIFTPEEGRGTSEQLRGLDLAVVSLDHRSVAGIRRSIAVVGERCGASASADSVIKRLDAEAEKLQRATKSTKRVLIALGANNATDDLSKIYISGNDGYYSSLLSIVGGVNVQQGKTYPLASVTVEGLRALAPEAVIELFPRPLSQSIKSERVKVWQEALKREVKVLIIDDESALIPGPQYIDLAKRISAFLRGE